MHTRDLLYSIKNVFLVLDKYFKKVTIIVHCLKLTGAVTEPSSVLLS